MLVALLALYQHKGGMGLILFSLRLHRLVAVVPVVIYSEIQTEDLVVLAVAVRDILEMQGGQEQPTKDLLVEQASLMGLIMVQGVVVVLQH